MGWQAGDFLESADSMKTRKDNIILEQKVAKEKEAWDNSQSIYKSMGIDDEDLMTNLHNAKYTKVNEELSPYMVNYFNTKGYKNLTDGTNTMLWKDGKPVVKDSGIVSDSYFEDNPYKTFSIENGVLQLHDDMKEGIELPEFTDPSKTRRQILVDDIPSAIKEWGQSLITETPKPTEQILSTGLQLPGTEVSTMYDGPKLEPSYEFFADPTNKYNEEQKDRFGRPDFRNRITVREKGSGKELTLFRGEDGKYYRSDKKSDAGTSFKIQGFGEKLEKIKEDIKLEYWNNENYRHITNEMVENTKFMNNFEDLKDIPDLGAELQRLRSEVNKMTSLPQEQQVGNKYFGEKAKLTSKIKKIELLLNELKG